MDASRLAGSDNDLISSPQVVREASLVHAAKEGQEWAYAELCRRNSTRLFRTLYKVTKNREDAEDALQDSFMRAFLHLKGFDGRSSFSTWITRIAINTALMILRKKKTSREVPMVISSDEGETLRALDVPDDALNPEEQYAIEEWTTHVQTQIRRLPKSLRPVIEILVLDKTSMRELAGTIGVSVPAAKSRLLRARASLRSSLPSTTR